MHSLYFIRHGKLLLPYADHSEMPFEVLVDLASGKMNPPIDTDFIQHALPALTEKIPMQDIKNIYASPSRRCQDTASFLATHIEKTYGRKVSVTVSLELQETHFDLAVLYPNKETFTIETVNDTILKATTSSDERCESAETLYKRCEDFFDSIQPEESLCISHDFFMRIVELYIKNHGVLDHKITYKELKGTQRNNYLQGFKTDFALSNFVSI